MGGTSSPRSSPRYGDELRPVRPGKPSVRTPVVKLGAATGDEIVPGPGAYKPVHVGKPRSSAWVMGDRAARKSSVEASGDSPGPVYSLPSSTTDKQVNSAKVSSPRFGFGTQPRLGGRAEATISPGPGAYSPRVTHFASPSQIQTVAAGQLTELTTPRGSIQITEGTWSRVINRSLANPREGPSAVTYTPSIKYTSHQVPAYTMRALGKRSGMVAGTVTPGPLAYNPEVKSRFGGGQMGDSPRFSCGKKDEDIPRFISNAHSRIYQVRHHASGRAGRTSGDLRLNSCASMPLLTSCCVSPLCAHRASTRRPPPLTLRSRASASRRIPFPTPPIMRHSTHSGRRGGRVRPEHAARQQQRSGWWEPWSMLMLCRRGARSLPLPRKNTLEAPFFTSCASPQRTRSHGGPV